MGGQRLSPIHDEILRVLAQRRATYARPIPSAELGAALHVAPSYIREQVSRLRALRLVGVRRGRGGGYYLHAAQPGRPPASTEPASTPG